MKAFIILMLLVIPAFAQEEEVTYEELKLLQWHHSELQASEKEGMHCNPVGEMDICVRMRKPATAYWMDTKTFLPTYIGSKRGKYFYLYNRGDKDLICNRPELTGPFSTSFVGDKRAVTPGNRLSFLVYFTPLSAGDHSTVMKLVCNDYNQPYEFLLTGKGIIK